MLCSCWNIPTSWANEHSSSFITLHCQHLLTSRARIATPPVHSLSPFCISQSWALSSARTVLVHPALHWSHPRKYVCGRSNGIRALRSWLWDPTKKKLSIFNETFQISPASSLMNASEYNLSSSGLDCVTLAYVHKNMSSKNIQKKMKNMQDNKPYLCWKDTLSSPYG